MNLKNLSVQSKKHKKILNQLNQKKISKKTDDKVEGKEVEDKSTFKKVKKPRRKINKKAIISNEIDTSKSDKGEGS